MGRAERPEERQPIPLSARAPWIPQRFDNKGTASPENRIRMVLRRQLYVEPADLEKFVSDKPMFGTRAAAIILGVSMDLMKKWRRCGRGPQYYQFEGIGSSVASGVSRQPAHERAQAVIKIY